VSRGETERGGVSLAPLAADLRVGSVLAGYRLEELLGRGGMGVVYRAEQLALGRTVALKLIAAGLSDSDRVRERFVREARTAAAIEHPNVVAVYDAGEADGLLYIAMRYVEGSDLAGALEKEGALEPGRALSILGQIAAALDAAHERDVVHRDVKPGNVLLGRERAYLADFGLTRAVSAATALTQDGHIVGTLDYMAPEQFEGKAVNARADVYSFGCMLYHCLVGSPPYEKDSQASLMFAHLQEPPPSLANRGLPMALDGVLAKAMAKRPEDRYASCSEVVEGARRALGGEPPEIQPLQASPTRVLVAGGEAGVRATIRLSLGDKGFEVLEADDRDGALALARREAPDLVLVDWRLGSELCGHLREDVLGPRAKLIAFGTRADGLDEHAARKAGADALLGRPFSSLQLLYAVGSLLGDEAVA
jgi:serine/threonine protein kinase